MGPAQVLSGIEDEPRGPADFRHADAALERHGAALALELLLGLPRARQNRAGTDRIHADARRKGERHGLRQSPQTDLAHGIGHEVGRQIPHPLVRQIDDASLRAVWQRIGEALHQDEGRAQIGLHVDVPGFARDAMGLVHLEAGGVAGAGERGTRAVPRGE